MDCPLIAHGVPVECLWMTAANRYLIDQKLIRRVRTMLIGSFRRKLLRRLLAQMVQAWHELAKFKKVETRTRAQLLEALKAQEALISAAEETLDEYARVLIGTEKSLENEARTQAHLTRIADDAHTELTALRLKSHAAQQEVLRLRTIMRHFEIRYPRATAILRIEVPDAAAMPDAAAAHVPMALEPFPPPPLAGSSNRTLFSPSFGMTGAPPAPPGPAAPFPFFEGELSPEAVSGRSGVLGGAIGGGAGTGTGVPAAVEDADCALAARDASTRAFEATRAASTFCSALASASRKI